MLDGHGWVECFGGLKWKASWTGGEMIVQSHINSSWSGQAERLSVSTVNVTLTADRARRDDDP